MLDISRTRTRIREIRKHLEILEKYFKGLSEKELIKDDRLNAEAERHLEIAIQACIDIANHIIASYGLIRPEKEASEAFTSLAKEDIIPEDFVDTMVKMTAYRNVIVHGYLDVDRRITYDNIQNHLVDISQFAKYIEEFLEKQA